MELFEKYFELITHANANGITKFIFRHDGKCYFTIYNGIEWSEPTIIDELDIV